MIHKITVFSLIALSFSLSTLSGARVELGRTGTHQLRISEAGSRSQLVSVPFLKGAMARGRLDGVDLDLSVFQDTAGAFSVIDDQFTYILRVTEGSSAGAWFFLGASSAEGRTVEVVEDGFAGRLSELEGNESFSVHALYTLNEIFPEDGTFLPAGAIDLKAMQVHFYDGREFKKFCLSNATITEHVGWTSAEEGGLVYAGETAILPGTSFLVLDPRTDVTVDIRIQGIVFDAPLNVPLYPGYNFVSSHYNKRFEGDTAFQLGNLGLKESGFRAGSSLQDGDQVLAYDTETGQFGEGFYLDDTTGEFSAPSEFQPGDGFVVFNSGDTYFWSPVK